MLCYAMLRYVLSCHVMLYYILPYYITLYCFAFYCIIIIVYINSLPAASNVIILLWLTPDYFASVYA